jgi:hypothetical protein
MSIIYISETKKGESLVETLPDRYAVMLSMLL